MSRDQLLNEYFKCPEGYHEPARKETEPDLSEILEHARPQWPRSFLPMDAAELIENLRHERYVRSTAAQKKRILHGLIRAGYYSVRPLLPTGVRKHLQRIALKGWQEKTFPAWPVDRTVDKIFEKLMREALQRRRHERIPFIWFWPEGKLGCVTMTHDVETPAGLRFCSPLMDLDDSYGIKSSFQIIPAGRYDTAPHQWHEIRTRGFEANIHDWNHDGYLFSNRETFLTRVQKINRSAEQHGAEGFRSAVLYRNTDWYDCFAFSYDMSVPNVGHLDPQPGGCCTVMPYFIGRILEIPVTTTQDYSLFHILGDYSIDLWKKQLDLILEKSGLASFIVHPDYIIARRARAVYKGLLDHLSWICQNRNIWIARPKDINKWWRDRSQMSLVKRDSHWEIEGPGKDLARLAYATLDGPNLVYTLEDNVPKSNGILPVPGLAS